MGTLKASTYEGEYLKTIAVRARPHFLEGGCGVHIVFGTLVKYCVYIYIKKKRLF